MKRPGWGILILILPGVALGVVFPKLLGCIGFAVIYTAILVVVFYYLPAAHRRWRSRWRIRRGKCPHCAYDLRRTHSTTCSECGGRITRTGWGIVISAGEPADEDGTDG